MAQSRSVKRFIRVTACYQRTQVSRDDVTSGIRFIGPTADVIEAMGDKVVARETAKNAGVPVMPGSNGPITDLDEAHRVAEEIGYPVLVKAAGGGGGIGMALVKRANKLERAIESCRDRGKSSFGNEAVYLEKYIESPRHIEVQVLFDQHEHGIHLFERECTLQRRHQKVVEGHRLPSSLRISNCAKNYARQLFVPRARSVTAMRVRSNL